MEPKRHGLYRAEILGTGARYARVRYRHGEFDVSEKQYRIEKFM